MLLTGCATSSVEESSDLFLPTRPITETTGPARRQASLIPPSELIFLGVLTGLYEDGVRNDVVERMIRVDEVTGMPLSFVFACPACMPAFDALRAYQSRPGFYRSKLEADTFGPGLGRRLRERVLSEEGAVHRAAVQDLISRWVDAFVSRLEWGQGEHEALAKQLEEYRVKGTALLEQYQQGGSEIIRSAPDLPESTREYYRQAARVYADWVACPTCEGVQRSSGAMPLGRLPSEYGERR